MMRLTKLTGAAISLSALFEPHAVLAAKPVESLPHVGKWVARFDENACHLIGQFGSDKDAVTLHMTRYAPTDSFSLRLYGPRFKWGSSTIGAGAVFQPDAKIERRPVMLGTLEKLPAALFGTYRLDDWQPRAESDVGPAISPQTEASITSVDVQFGSAQRFRLLTGSMAKPMATMRTCMDSLLKHWGFDPQEQARLQRTPNPVTRPETWVRSGDYPQAELSRGQSGLVQFRLDVGADGKVERCAILASTKSEFFQTATCGALSKHARFEPAINAEGKPVRSFYVNAVRWLIPQ